MAASQTGAKRTFEAAVKLFCVLFMRLTSVASGEGRTIADKIQ